MAGAVVDKTQATPIAGREGWEDPRVARLRGQLLGNQAAPTAAGAGPADATGFSASTNGEPGSLGGVRFVATVMAVLGWITLVGVIGILSMGSQISAALGPRGNSVALAGVAAAIVPLLLLALGPFFLWALLKALCELHAQGERTIAAINRLAPTTFAGGAKGHATSTDPDVAGTVVPSPTT